MDSGDLYIRVKETFRQQYISRHIYAACQSRISSIHEPSNTFLWCCLAPQYLGVTRFNLRFLEDTEHQSEEEKDIEKTSVSRECELLDDLLGESTIYVQSIFQHVCHNIHPITSASGGTTGMVTF